MFQTKDQEKMKDFHPAGITGFHRILGSREVNLRAEKKLHNSRDSKPPHLAIKFLQCFHEEKTLDEIFKSRIHLTKFYPLSQTLTSAKIK